MTWEKCFPILQEGEARLIEARDRPTLDPIPPSRIEAEIILKIETTTALGPRAHLMLTILVLIRHQVPPPKAKLARTEEGRELEPEADLRREAASPPAAPIAQLEDRGATEAVVTAVTGGVLEKRCHTH